MMFEKPKTNTRAVWILAAMATALFFSTTDQVRAAELTYEATVQVSENESVFNVSVFSSSMPSTAMVRTGMLN